MPSSGTFDDQYQALGGILDTQGHSPPSAPTLMLTPTPEASSSGPPPPPMHVTVEMPASCVLSPMPYPGAPGAVKGKECHFLNR